MKRLLQAALLSLALCMHGAPTALIAQDRAEIAAMQLALGNVDLDGKLGRQTNSAIGRFAFSKGIPNDFWSVFAWIERASEMCRTPIESESLTKQITERVAHDLYDPESTRIRNLYLAGYGSTILMTHLNFALNDYQFASLDQKSPTEIPFPSYDDIVRETITFEPTIDFCGEINSKNLFGGYTGYTGFYYDGRVHLENDMGESKFKFLTNCRIDPGFARCAPGGAKEYFEQAILDLEIE